MKRITLALLFCVAIQLCDGAFSLAHFENESFEHYSIEANPLGAIVYEHFGVWFVVAWAKGISIVGLAIQWAVCYTTEIQWVRTKAVPLVFFVHLILGAMLSYAAYILAG